MASTHEMQHGPVALPTTHARRRHGKGIGRSAGNRSTATSVSLRWSINAAISSGQSSIAQSGWNVDSPWPGRSRVITRTPVRNVSSPMRTRRWSRDAVAPRHGRRIDSPS